MAVKKPKPQLIEESRIRRWGKLANIPAYTEKFLKENFEFVQEEEEEEMPPTGDSPMPPETTEPSPEMPPTEEPAGSSVSEPEVQDLVKAIADAITAQTGVSVEVEGQPSAGDEGGMEGEEMPPTEEPPMPPEAGAEEEPPMQETGSKRTPEATPPDRKPDMAREGKQSKKPVVKEEKVQGNEEKKTMPGEQGKVKSTARPKVDGAEKPEPTDPPTNSYPHKLKALEESLLKNPAFIQKVLERVRKSSSRSQIKKTNAC
jgi:hypothetical protein